MKSYVYLALLGCALSANPVFAQSATSKIAPSKGWLSDLAAARAQAQKTGKPMLVVFRCDP